MYIRVTDVVSSNRIQKVSFTTERYSVQSGFTQAVLTIRRDFTIWESFSVSFSVLGLLPSIASTITFCLGFSGTGGSVWGYLISALFIQSTAFSMAELCSSMPTAGKYLLYTKVKNKSS